MNKIPIDSLSNDYRRIHIRRFKAGDVPSTREQRGTHRDDHYIFFLFDQGTADMVIDFEIMQFRSAQAFYIFPGQVHTRINNFAADGWFLAVDTELIPPNYRKVFESSFTLQQPINMCTEGFNQCVKLMELIQERSIPRPKRFNRDVLSHLLAGLTAIFAEEYVLQIALEGKVSRGKELTEKFKSILKVRFKELKSPSAYACSLNVSESYLNEVVRKQTGFSVSHWINKEVILEAKRLLYYTNLDVKEIAHNLGYDDHTYFFKRFKKFVGISPLKFRNENRK